MKLSSSVSCGCCFCCYCRSWLMMLLMVSSVIHVSPEMSTTTTTSVNLNNYYRAMTKFAKFNTKLPSRAATTNSLPDAHKGNNKQDYPTLQPDMATALATMQTLSSRRTTTTATTPTTVSSSSEQIAMTRQSLDETMPTLRIEKRQRDEQDLFYRSSTSGTPALTGDNYDVVIRTTDTTDTIESPETIGVARTRNVQITVLDGDININSDSDNDINSKTLKYPSTESNASEQHKHHARATRTTTTTTQNTKHATDSHTTGHEQNQNYNNGAVQRTNIAQTATDSSKPTTQQYNPSPMSTSSTNLINSSKNNNMNSTTIISMDINKDNGNTEETSSHMPVSTTTPTSSHLQRTDSALMQLEYNQLKRPALLSSSTHPLHRHTRQVEAEAVDKCRLFVEGDPEKNELYSPDYPNDYPKNINCTRIITAPKGQIIRLDFRNSFRIEEKEECKFDFLEIRDGQYGFSNLLGRFCGSNFPPEITSKERYLWLHFNSDESIEYSGFTAVYEFIDRTRDAPSTDLNCTIDKNGSEGFINSTDVPKEIRDAVVRNKIPLDCMWRIEVTEKWKIQVKFIDFKLTKPNDCETNFLDIFPEQTVMPLRVKNFCGSAGEGVTSESNILNMRFYAEQVSINSSFAILYTAFKDRGVAGCGEDEYDCEDATCITANLKCNGRDNCKFRWDEEGCKTEDEGQSEHMIIIITVFGLILGGMVITFLVNCVRKIMHDQKIIREHIRQSKESKLDEMGRNSKARSRDNISIVSPRQKHSQTSLQILDDVSNRYYREMELQAKGNFKEKEPLHIMRHDMIVQTSLCSTDDSSTTTTAEPQAGACDMGCQTRESLFATGSLLRSKSKTPSVAGGGGHRSVEGVPPPPRFSTFGYDAAQMAATAPAQAAMGGASTLSRRNIHLPQASIEAEHPPNQAHMAMMPPQQQHRHLHQRPSQEICHHHHQHQQQQHQQHQQHQQQQQQKHTLPRHQHQHLQEQYHQPSTAPQITTMPATGTTIVTAISTGSSATRARDAAATAAPAGAGGASKNKQTKIDESKLFIDIRNSAPDVIIMTSH